MASVGSVRDRARTRYVCVRRTEAEALPREMAHAVVIDLRLKRLRIDGFGGSSHAWVDHTFERVGD